jgi:hypothetical protein
VFGADFVLAIGHAGTLRLRENPGKLWTIMLNERLSGNARDIQRELAWHFSKLSPR